MQQAHRQQASRQPAAHASGSAIALSGSWSDASAVNTQLARASECAHLVAPATAVAVLPDGCSVVLSTVLVDVERETYDVSGKRGLGKTALDRIAAAAGISWSPRESGRVDDASDPYYCVWHAVGTVRHLDGTEVTIEGSKEMDLRDGSPQVEALYERFEAAKRDTRRRSPPKDPTAQIREMRLHIMAHAESKARLRAIRSLGIRTAYEPQELERPFVVARLMFTGQSDDPAIRHEFARMTALSMLGGRNALYGREIGTRAALPVPVLDATPRGPRARLAPPPVGTSRFDDDEDVPGVTRDSAPLPAQRTPAQPAAARDEDGSAETERTYSGVCIPGGNAKGAPIEEASDRDLEYWEQRISKALADGSSRYPDKDRATVEAMRRELSFRSEGGR